MPRKTRQQKERSIQRRQSPPTNPSIVKREFEFSFTDSKISQTDKISSNKHDKSLYFSNSASISYDLVKTIILAIGIFSLEIMIYFAWFKKSGPGYQIYQLIINFVDKF